MAVIALVLLAGARTVPAANIVWVSDYNDPSVGFFPAGSGLTDSGFVTLLQNAGHSVIRFNPSNTATTALTPAEVAALNTNDLIIIGRASGSGAYRLLQGNQWNTAVTKPLICMSPYLVRTIADNRMGWFVGDVGPDDTTTFATAADAANPAVDYLLGGVAMLGNTTVSLFNELLDRNTSHILGAPQPGGRTLLTATFARDDNGTIATGQLIADFPAGTVVSLSNAPLAAYRMFMAGGSRESATFPLAIPQYTGRENLTPAGENIFLRAVQLAINSGVPPATDPAEPVGFTGQLSDVTVIRGGSVTLSISVTGAAPRTIEWQRDTGDGVTFLAIPGASTTFSASSITLTNLDLADSGAKFRVVASNPNNTVTSDVATLTVTPDDAPPVPLSAGSIDGSTISVCFDELLNNAPENNPAIDPFSYALTDSGGAQVITVTLGQDGRSVTLGLSAPVSPGYTLTISLVDDRFGNGIPDPGVTLAGAFFGLSSADVGALNPAGATSASCAAGSFVVAGGGLDIQATVEQMRLVYKTVTGDFDARIRVNSLTGVTRLETVAKAILGARASTDANAMSVNAFVTPPTQGDSSYGSTARATTGGLSVSNFLAVAYAPGAVPATFPAWLRIRRAGDVFTTFGSNNGNDWTQIGSITVAMGPTALVGAGVNSHRNGHLAFGTFSNFTITQAPDQPTITGLSYAGGSFSGSFQSQGGFAYTIQYKDDLNAASWSTLTTIAGDGTVKSFTDAGPAGTQRFYQVVIIP